MSTCNQKFFPHPYLPDDCEIDREQHLAESDRQQTTMGERDRERRGRHTAAEAAVATSFAKKVS